ncbi:MAG: glycosyltransferase [Chitinophagales bacterium]|nr:glycosyltransferase [Chitinophagales bacterium]
MKDSFPLVSVYVTNYNYSRYIKQSIESVLSQSFQDFELLIIDDGSTDNSKDIIEEYRDNPKVEIIYQQNKGLNVTNNIALRACRGKYIMRLDADDYLRQDALEKMCTVLENDNSIGLVFPDYYLIDENGRTTEEFRRYNFDDEVSLLDKAAHGACTMIRVDYLKELGGYNESFSCQDGYELWVKFTEHHRITNIGEPLFYYRRHSTNLTRDETKILSTRARINELYSRDRFGSLKALCIIPVRNSSLAFKTLAGKRVIDYKIEAAMAGKVMDKVVISSPSDDVAQHVKDKYYNNNKILFHKRDEKEARLNVNLVNTVHSVLGLTGTGFDAITILTIEYPFVKPYVIDDAINTMFLFNSDSIISVRQENSLMFQHHGDGMHPILNQDKFTKLERESLYRLTGGISATRTDRFLKNNKITFGKIGHVMIDQLSAIGLFSDFDFYLAEALIKNSEKTQISDSY